MIPDLRDEKKFHILIVNVWPEDVTLLRHLLTPQYHLTATDNRASALKTLEHGTVDIVLLATATPDITPDLMRLMHSKPEWAGIPVILILDEADNTAIAEGLRQGATDYLTRPLDRAIVCVRVETQITLKRKTLDHERIVSELQAAQKLRERFFSVASHDLKNPINNIRLALFLLDKMIEHNEENLKLLHNVDLSLDTMENIIRDFLEIAVLQSPSVGLQLEPLKVEDLLWDTMMEYSTAAVRKNIELRIEDMDGVIYADLNRMKQVIGNLISNAIKYSPWSKSVTVSSVVCEDWVRIQIADKGPGIPVEERDRLFSEFGRLSTRPTGGETSTGLGLWIVKQLVTLQQGQVGAEFPAGGGTIFWVELPLNKAAPVASQESLASAV